MNDRQSVAHDDSTMLVRIEQVAKMLDVAPRTIRRMVLREEMPEPLAVGRSKRWLLGTLRSWISQGCPRLDEQNGRRKESA